MPQSQSHEIIFQENEYDILENKLLKLSNSHDVYRSLANFLARKFECKYVLFYSDIYVEHGVVLNYGERIPHAMNMRAEIDERKQSSVDDNALLRHKNGGFSVPFNISESKKGYIFIGPRMDDEFHTMNIMREMIPVVRTLNHVLVYLTAMKEREARERLRNAFAKYVSSDVVDTIIENPSDVNLGGENANLSVIFTDLQEFTSLSETLEPEKLVKILNMYFSEMSEVIFGLGGTIDKFEGDAIMAFFGAPKKLEDHAVRCCIAALRLSRMERILNEQLMVEHLISEPLYTRIGINTGDMVVGNVGSATRFEYTIIGSNVNIASRIEDCNKKYDTQILISEQTYNAVKDLFECRFVDEAYLKGVSKPVKIYELVSEKDSLLSNIRLYDRQNGMNQTAPDIVELEPLEELVELNDD